MFVRRIEFHFDCPSEFVGWGDASNDSLLSRRNQTEKNVAERMRQLMGTATVMLNDPVFMRTLSQRLEAERRVSEPSSSSVQSIDLSFLRSERFGKALRTNDRGREILRFKIIELTSHSKFDLWRLIDVVLLMKDEARRNLKVKIPKRNSIRSTMLLIRSINIVLTEIDASW